MKTIIPFIIFSSVHIMAQAWTIDTTSEQRSCEQAQAELTSDKEILKLTNKVCRNDLITDPDEIIAHQQEQAHLTPKDNLLYEYTYRCYDILNHVLRIQPTSEYYNHPDYVEARNLSYQLDGVLCEQPAFEGFVYRGSNWNEDLLKTLKEGELTTLPGFTSTSRLAKKACLFTKNIFFKIHSKTGRKIGDKSRSQEEEEVLFRHNTKFVIEKIIIGTEAAKAAQCHHDTTTHYVELREI